MTSAEILYEMETQIMANIARMLGAGSDVSAEWQMKKLAEIGTLRRENVDIVRGYIIDATDSAREEIIKAGNAAAVGFDKKMDADSLAAALAPDTSPTLRAIWTTWETKTMQQFRNLGMTLINSAEKIYIETITKATAQALAGQITLRQAIAQAATDWSATGLAGLVDAGNRKWSVEAYAQTVIKSNIRQVVTETVLGRSKELGNNLVEVSSHIGARPLCELYQGRIYCLEGDKESTGYPNLYNDTSYGEIAGLFGINCGHQMYPYIEGTEQTFEPYSKEQNDEVYDESQQQRAFERSIRSAKRKLEIANALNDPTAIEAAKQRVSEKQANIRKFIDETGRTRRNAREQIF